MKINRLYKKYWFAFFIIILFDSVYTYVWPTGSNRILTISCVILGSVLCLSLVRFYLQEPLEEYGLHLKSPHIQLICILLITFTISFFAFFRNLTKDGTTLVLTKSTLKNIGELFPVSFTILLLASVTYEEVLFRGFLLTFFQKLTDSSFLGVFISAFWFGLMHYSSSGTLEENLERLISAFIFGIIYGYLRVKEPQKFTLFSLSIGHFLNDFIALILPAILYA